MKSVKLGSKILLSCVAITASQAKANIYVGLGTSISNDSYSANSEDLGQAKNLQKVSALATQNSISYDGTLVQMLLNVKNNAPKASTFNPTLFSKFNDKQLVAGNLDANVFIGCVDASGYLSSTVKSKTGTTPTTINATCPQGGTAVKLTANQFYEDIGSAFLYNLKQNDPLYQESFSQNSIKDKLSEDVGREIIKSIVSAQDPKIDTNSITMDDINGWFQATPTGKLANINKGIISLDSSGQGLITVDPTAVTDILGIYGTQWNQVATGIQNALIKNQGLINTNGIIKSSGSGSNYGFLASVGYLLNINKFFYGGELVLDFGKYTMGKNQDMELEVSRNLSLGLVGKVGYSFFNKTLNYINMGLSASKYSAKGFGIDASSTIMSYVIGGGMEFMLYQNFNMFLEYQYHAGLTKLDTEVVGAKKLNLKSQKFNIGFRYYFEDNALASRDSYGETNNANQSLDTIKRR